MGCELDQEKQENSCRATLEAGILQGSITKYIDKPKGNVLRIPQEALKTTQWLPRAGILPNEREVCEIRCYSLDTEIINKQFISEKMKRDLIIKNSKMRESLASQMIFYTDGSLRSRNTSLQNESVRMGASWVQVNEEENQEIDVGYFGARNWPSSTKAELLGIWYVLLLVPNKRKVKIYTDSAVAIESIEGRKKRRKQCDKYLKRRIII